MGLPFVSGTKKWMGKLGAHLPFESVRSLSKLSPKFSYLLQEIDPFWVDDYLGDLKFWVDPKTAVGREILGGNYEPGIQSVISLYVQPGQHCIDVGANVGAISLALAKKVGPTGRVYCFEPGIKYFSELQKNVQANPELEPQMELRPLGLSKSSKEKRFWKEDERNPGNASLGATEGLQVKVTSLDEFWPRDRKLSFMKIDVEGMEYEVLKGGENTIREHRPVIIFETSMEFEKTASIPIRKLAQELLLASNYHLFDISRDGSLSEISYPHFKQNTLALPVKGSC